MEVTKDPTGLAAVASTRTSSGSSSAHRGNDGDPRQELLVLLMQRKVPEKDEIIRVKELVQTLARDGGPDGATRIVPEDFISAYLDLYLGRITGDAAIEKDSLRRCIDCVGASRSER